MRWIQFDLNYFKKSDKWKNLLEQVNKILYREEGVSENYYKNIGDIVPWELAEDKNKNRLRESMPIYEWIYWLIKHPNSSFVKDGDIKFYDKLEDIPITKSSEIFFLPDADVSILKKIITRNEDWNRLSLYKKLIVCSPFVSAKEYYEVTSEYFEKFVSGKLFN